MNPREVGLLEVSGDAWRLHGPGAGVSGARQAGDPWDFASLAATLHGRPVVLALGSLDCFTARLADGAQRHASPAALAYQLEAFIPAPAEALVSAFLATSAGPLGVAALRENIDALLAALEAAGGAGVRVLGVCPLLLLAGAGVTLEDGTTVWDDGEAGYADLVQATAGRIENWSVCPNAPGGLAAHLSLSGMGSPPHRQAGVRADAARIGMRRILAGEVDWPVDLLPRSPSGRTRSPAVRLVAAALLALSCITASLFYRGHRYDLQAARCQAEQAQAFAGALPGQPLPIDPASRLASELRRMNGNSAQGDGIPARAPASTSLANVILALPTQLRYSITDLRLEEGRLALEGQVATHADADALAAALSSTSFSIDPVRTEQIAGGKVNFFITGAARAVTP